MEKKQNNSRFQSQKGRNLAQKVLKKITTTKEKSKKLKMLYGVSRVNAPWIEDVYLNLLEDPCEEVRDFITKELGKRENLDLEKVCLKLSSPLWYVKCGALRILDIQKNPDCVKFIGHSLKDRNAEVRRIGAQALGEIGGREALGLLAKLTKDKNKFVKKAAEEALRKASQVRFS